MSVPGGSALARAQAVLRAGDATGAIHLLLLWLESHPDDVTARITLGDAYRATGERTRAEVQFQHALRVRPDSAEALMALGSLYDQLGQPEKAEPLLARAVENSHGSAPARLEWATVLARLHRYSVAAAALVGVPAPQRLDQRIAYQRLRASIDLGTGNARAAAADMEQALRMAPQNQGLLLATGIAEAQAGNWIQTIQLLEPLFNATHDPRAGLALLEAQIAQNRNIAPTLAGLREAGLPPDQELAFRAHLGETLSRAGLHAEAVGEFEKAVSEAPDRVDLLFDLALAQFRAGKFDAALGTAERTKAREDSAELENLLGDIQEKRGDSLFAIRSYQAAVALAPHQEEYRLALGLEFIRHETFEAALTVFEQAAHLFPQSMRTGVALGMTYFFVGRYPDATRTLLQATQLDSKPTLAFEYLGETQLEQPGSPNAVALDRLCRYSDAHLEQGKMASYCGALLLRQAYAAGEAKRAPEIMRRLALAERLLPGDPMPRCQLGKVYEWMGEWQEARAKTEACLRLQPDSSEAHYRLARLYQRLGQTELSRKEMELQAEAARHLAEANARRQSTLKTFLYNMKDKPSQ